MKTKKKNYREFWLSKKLCGNCGSRPIVEGKTKCSKCQESQRKYQSEHPERCQEANRKWNKNHQGIYAWICDVNDKCYIGSGQFKNRHHKHLNMLRAGKHFNDGLQEDWNMFGEQNFEFVVLYETQVPVIQKWLEKTLIVKLLSQDLTYNKNIPDIEIID